MNPPEPPGGLSKRLCEAGLAASGAAAPRSLALRGKESAGLIQYRCRRPARGHLPPPHLLLQAPLYDITGVGADGPGSRGTALRPTEDADTLTSSLYLQHTPHTDKTWKINV